MRISQLAKQTGLSLIEVLVAGLVVGTAIVGMSLMYGTGSSWVASTGDDRVASGLAQQRIEQIRALGWGCVTTLPPPPATPPCEIAIGILMSEAAVYPAGTVNPSVRSFTRDTCIQYADPNDPNGLNAPDYTSACIAGAVPTTMVRITVTVTPIGTGTSNQALGQPNPVTLQAWLAQ